MKIKGNEFDTRFGQVHKVKQPFVFSCEPMALILITGVEF